MTQERDIMFLRGVFYQFLLYNITQIHPVLTQAITLLLFGYHFGNYVQLI